MPTYGYRCTECKSEFERFQKITDAPVATCDSCGGPVKRILYPVGIQFKGTGFYVTDYKGAGKEPATTGSASASKATESSSTTATSTATETKTETSAAPAANTNTTETK